MKIAATFVACPGVTALTIGLAVAPVSVAAQIEPSTQVGSRIPVKPKAVDTRNGGPFRKGFARCVYRRYTDKVALFLSHSDPLSVDYAKAHISSDRIDRELGMDDCLGEQADGTQQAIGLSMAPRSLRAMLQEEDYLEHYTAPPSLPAEAKEFTDRSYVSAGDDLNVAKGLGVFADCLAYQDTPHADALLRTLPGSRDEAAAARSLSPTLGACLLSGQTLSLTPSNVRALAADGLWTRYVSQVAAASEQANEKP